MYYLPSIILILIGAFLLLFAIVKYINSLIFVKNKNYENRLFTNWIYAASLGMMIFFFIGYIIMIWAYSKYSDIKIIDFFITLIFFFGAIFVYSMVVVQKSMSETILEKKLEVITALINSVEAKDRYTRGHSLHVYGIVNVFYEYLPHKYKATIDRSRLLDAALLHDIGKISIPDSILNKPGKLTDPEYEQMRAHPSNGKKILEKTSYVGITDWILYHHERVDGQGYYQLKSEDIPIESKIISIADTFSALYTDRVYRRSLTFCDAMNVLVKYKGTQHDSELVDIFLTIDQKELDLVSTPFKI